MKFRREFEIPIGLSMHFADIKHLLDENTNHPYDQQWFDIFQRDSEKIDNRKMHEFYKELLELVSSLPMKVFITGYRWDHLHRIRSQKKSFKQKNTYLPPYIALREHMNMLSFYLLGLDKEQPIKEHRITKLRYDGDVGLGERDDIKEAYHHSITLGTKHFRPQTITKLFDEIRFIGKNEVAQNESLPHAGSEIVDFLATIISRDLWKLETEKIPIEVPGLPSINPLEWINKLKITKQKINDVEF
ncbi:hypothetical protein RZN25_06325 [Bacillaceae bacterium S4-13-56]